MIFKKLSKEDLEDGLTLDFVNKISMKRNYSPVLFKKGAEPTSILACSTGFWIMIDGKAKKDEHNKMVVVTELECQLARARYLFFHGADEKEKKIQDLIAYWKREARAKLDNYKNIVEYKRKSLEPDNKAIHDLLKQLGEKQPELQIRKSETELYKEMNDQYLIAESMWEQGQFVDLIDGLGIANLGHLMLSVKTDDEQAMKVLKNTFGGDALNKWDGKDMLYKYAQIEIEKQYTI